MGPSLSNWLSEPRFWNLTDVTLADEDTNSILTDNANRAIQGNVTQPGGQMCNILVAKFVINASDAIWIYKKHIGTGCNNFEAKYKWREYILHIGQMKQWMSKK